MFKPAENSICLDRNFYTPGLLTEVSLSFVPSTEVPQSVLDKAAAMLGCLPCDETDNPLIRDMQRRRAAAGLD